MSFDVCVVGAGRMGASIAGHLALQGARVALFDRSDFDRKKGYEIMRADMKNLLQRGLLLPEDKDAALERITLVETHEQCVQSSILIEAIFEDLEAKRTLFAALEGAAIKQGTDPILSSNSMNFSIGQITRGITSANRKVCGVRFLHPVFFVRVVEVSGHDSSGAAQTSPTICGAMALLKRFGMDPFYVYFPAPTPQAGNLCLNCASKLFEPERVSATCPTCRQRIERVLTADISS